MIDNRALDIRKSVALWQGTVWRYHKPSRVRISPALSANESSDLPLLLQMPKHHCTNQSYRISRIAATALLTRPCLLQHQQPLYRPSLPFSLTFCSCALQQRQQALQGP